MALDPLFPVSLALVMAVLALVFTVRVYHDKVGALREELDAARERSSVRDAARATWRSQAPYAPQYPLDPRRLRHLGRPVSGVHFEADRVVFVEFLADGEPLTEEAERVRDNVRAGRVEWLEVRPTQALQPPTS